MIFSSWEQAAQLARDCQAHGGIVVTTNGCFDVLHAGHVRYLSQARGLGDLLIVALNDDASVTKLKGIGRPINPLEARGQVVAALRSVNFVCCFSEPTPVEWLKVIKPDIHVKGGDYDAAKMIESSIVAQWGGRCQTLAFVDGFSSSKILDKIKGSG